jgi:hypothetical protein
MRRSCSEGIIGIVLGASGGIVRHAAHRIGYSKSGVTALATRCSGVRKA